MKLPKLSNSNKLIFLGIDVHKKTYHISLIDKDGEKLSCKSLPACPESLVNFLKNNFKHYQIHSAYEAGFSGFALHRALRSSGIANIVFNPASLPTAPNDRVKTDRLDSLKIARSLLKGLLPPNHVPSISNEASRALSRTRQQLVEMRVAIGNQIKSKLFQFGYIEASDNNCFSLKWLNSVLDENPIPSTIRRSILAQLEVYKSLSYQIGQLEKQMDSDLRKNREDELRIIRSVPGVGTVSASIILNELGLVGRFNSMKKIYSYTGLTPTEYSSGEKQRFGNISRRGNSRLRSCLTEVSWRAIRKDTGLRAIYEKLKQRRGAKKAILAVARRLMGRIRSCLINNEMYRFSEV